jgi:hypothetical protein
MRRARTFLASTALAACLIVPGLASPAAASHNCNLEEVDHTVDTICDNYHNPKPLLEYLLCVVSPTC